MGHARNGAARYDKSVSTDGVIAETLLSGPLNDLNTKPLD